MTNEDGKVIIHYEYDAFGNITYQDGSLENSYQYQTKEYDAQSGLVYFGARYYDPAIGRFTTADPLGIVDGPNVYVYCANNPIGFVDPWGLCGEKTWWEKLEEGYYYGTGFGQSSAERCAQQQLETGNPASLWTPETWMTTVDTLLLAVQLNQILKASYWQYYPKDNSAYKSDWLTRGLKPPHASGEDAYKALNLKESMGRNPGTAVRKVDVKPWEPVRGPRKVSGGTGKEYYRGWRWPK